MPDSESITRRKKKTSFRYSKLVLFTGICYSLVPPQIKSDQIQFRVTTILQNAELDMQCDTFSTHSSSHRNLGFDHSLPSKSTTLTPLTVFQNLASAIQADSVSSLVNWMS